MRPGRPLPLHPAGSVEVNQAVHLIENDQGGVVFIWGMAAWCWERDDVVGRRLAAVSLVETEAAGPGEVATAFGVTYETVRQWRQAWSEAGTEALVPQKPGPTGRASSPRKCASGCASWPAKAWGCSPSPGR